MHLHYYRCGARLHAQLGHPERADGRHRHRVRLVSGFSQAGLSGSAGTGSKYYLLALVAWSSGTVWSYGS